MMQPARSYEDPTRANDVDRAAVCAILDNAYATGELDAEEHRQRCSWAMLAKTRGQLLNMISDLQEGRPAFSQQPAITVNENPKRKWIVAAAAGGSLAAVAVIGFVLFGGIGSRHSSPNPAPAAPVAAPTAPVAAPTETGGPQTTGNFVALVDVVGMVSGDFQDSYGHAPERVNCPGDLDGRVGAFERCSILDKGQRYTADVTVTAINDGRISTHDSINEDAPAPGH
jgi:Domain of unknown function (DUF1707)/Domain of unknown function (DUF4333)